MNQRSTPALVFRQDDVRLPDSYSWQLFRSQFNAKNATAHRRNCASFALVSVDALGLL